MFDHSQLVEDVGDFFFLRVRVDAFEQGEHLEVLSHSQFFPEHVELRAVADEELLLVEEVFFNVSYLRSARATMKSPESCSSC